MALCGRETLTSVLSVQALEGLHVQHNEHVFLHRMRAAEIFKDNLPRNTGGSFVAIVSAKRWQYNTMRC